MPISYKDVFKENGQPSITYIRQDQGKHEIELEAGLDSKGTICLITGPSKTGKTTLYTEVLKSKGLEQLKVKCNQSLLPEDVWRSALEKINFSQIAEITTEKVKESKIGGMIQTTLGWKWLAGLVAQLSSEFKSTVSDSIVKKRILANPNPDHLVPVLKYLPYVLVIEDFHYLMSETQETLSQQWKTFIDEEISIIVVDTTHHALDLAKINKDLALRYVEILRGSWLPKDLRQIPNKGFEELGIKVPESVKDIIAAESVGLPIVAQSVCLRLCLIKALADKEHPEEDFKFTNRHVFQALSMVCSVKFKTHSTDYQRFITGLGGRSRAYNMYELILRTFSLDPPVFTLNIETIETRLASVLTYNGINLTPSGSVIYAALKSLRKFQAQASIQLLEWDEREKILYILEPTFLFFLRWREARPIPPTIADILRGIAEKLAKNLPKRQTTGVSNYNKI
jgi:hypothetical protein